MPTSVFDLAKLTASLKNWNWCSYSWYTITMYYLLTLLQQPQQPQTHRWMNRSLYSLKLQNFWPMSWGTLNDELFNIILGQKMAKKWRNSGKIVLIPGLEFEFLTAAALPLLWPIWPFVVRIQQRNVLILCLEFEFLTAALVNIILGQKMAKKWQKMTK